MPLDRHLQSNFLRTSAFLLETVSLAQVGHVVIEVDLAEQSRRGLVRAIAFSRAYSWTTGEGGLLLGGGRGPSPGQRERRRLGRGVLRRSEGR
jgi:hypothetical protein